MKPVPFKCRKNWVLDVTQRHPKNFHKLKVNVWPRCLGDNMEARSPHSATPQHPKGPAYQRRQDVVPSALSGPSIGSCPGAPACSSRLSSRLACSFCSLCAANCTHAPHAPAVGALDTWRSPSVMEDVEFQVEHFRLSTFAICESPLKHFVNFGHPGRFLRRVCGRWVRGGK